MKRKDISKGGNGLQQQNVENTECKEKMGVTQRNGVRADLVKMEF